jgi:hypothetical protein
LRFKKTNLTEIPESATSIIDGIDYEKELTSGGAVDLPVSLLGKLRSPRP